MSDEFKIRCLMVVFLILYAVVFAVCLLALAPYTMWQQWREDA